MGVLGRYIFQEMGGGVAKLREKLQKNTPEPVSGIIPTRPSHPFHNATFDFIVI